MRPFSITCSDLNLLLGSSAWPLVLDVRVLPDVERHAVTFPAAERRRFDTVGEWSAELPRNRPIVVFCDRGLKLSQAVAAELRSDGFEASQLAGGFVAWLDAGLPTVDRAAMDRYRPEPGTRWVTRVHPKIDRIACPWLIRRFVDPAARFLFVETDQVKAVSDRTGAIPFDVEGVPLTHVGERCSFDTMLDVFGLQANAPLARLATIVRGADTARLDLAPEAAGLLAVSLGLSALIGEDDHGLLAVTFPLYDGLYAWAARAASETHNWPANKGTP